MCPAVFLALRASLVLGLAVAGCTSTEESGNKGNGPTDAAQDGTGTTEAKPPRIELGTGAGEFASLPKTGNPEVELEFGPQGGWHVTAATRIHGLEIDGLVLEYAVFDENGARRNLPSMVTLTSRRVLKDGDGWLRLGDLVIFDIQSTEEVTGTVVEISVDATDTAGNTARDRRSVTVVDDE